MDAIGLLPNKPADPYTILRRLTFSLTGLPPSIEQQDRFSKLVENGLEQAVSEFSDELLSSPILVKDGQGIGWTGSAMQILMEVRAILKFPMPIATEII